MTLPTVASAALPVVVIPPAQGVRVGAAALVHRAAVVAAPHQQRLLPHPAALQAWPWAALSIWAENDRKITVKIPKE